VGGRGGRGEKGEEKIEPHFQIFATVQFLSTNRLGRPERSCHMNSVVNVHL